MEHRRNNRHRETEGLVGRQRTGRKSGLPVESGVSLAFGGSVHGEIQRTCRIQKGTHRDVPW